MLLDAHRQKVPFSFKIGDLNDTGQSSNLFYSFIGLDLSLVLTIFIAGL